jgi:hypothetical protein
MSSDELRDRMIEELTQLQENPWLLSAFIEHTKLPSVA